MPDNDDDHGAPDAALEELRAQNAMLRAELAGLRTQSQPAGASGETGGTIVAPRQRWRPAVASVFVVMAAILAPAAVVVAFAEKQVNDTSAFVATFGPLIRDADVQSLIVDTTVARIDDAVNIDQLTADAVGGIADLTSLPPRAVSALHLLEGPAAEGIRSLLRESVRTVVTSDALADVWDETLRTSSVQLKATLSNDPNAIVRIDGDGAVGVQIAPIIAEVKQILSARGFTFANLIPDIQATVPIAEARQLGPVQFAYQLLGIVGTLLPWLTLVLLVAAVLIAKRRARTSIVAAVVLAAAMGVLGIALAIGRALFVTGVAHYVPQGAATAIYDAVVAGMASTAAAVGALALAVAVVGYVAGPFRSSRALRRWTNAGADRARATAEHYGVTTGRVGAWVFRSRMLLRAAIALVAAAVVLFVRPMSVSLVLGTGALAILAVTILELVGRPSAPLPSASLPNASGREDPEPGEYLRADASGQPSST